MYDDADRFGRGSTDDLVDEIARRETADPAAWRTAGRWWVPDEIRVEDGELVPALRPDRRHGRQVVQATSGDDENAMLGDFVELVSATEARAFARYASRWGMLRLCAHGLPATHDKTTLPESLARPGRSISSDSEWDVDRCVVSFLVREPIATWRYWARQARALLVVSERLAAGQLGGDDEWAELQAPGPWARDWPLAEPLTLAVRDLPDGGKEYVPSGPWASGPEWRESVVHSLDDIVGERGRDQRMAMERHSAGETLEHWLTLAGVGLTVSWTGTSPDMAWRSGGLFGALGMKLLLAASRVPGWALCAGCAKPHIPARQARRGSSRFCSDCRMANVPARTRANRRYDARRTDPTFRQRERERLRAYRERQRGRSSSEEAR